MKAFLTLCGGLVAAVLAAGCREVYTPDIPASATDFLVVDGYINTLGVSTIKLSHTAPLAVTDTPLERQATVYILDEAGTRFPLAEAPAGTYTSANLRLVASRSYRLHITTKAGKEYESAPVPAKITPPIDKLSWKFEHDGVQLYLDTHDDTRSSTYYRWSYLDTWQFTVKYRSDLKYSTTTQQFQPRLYPDSIRIGWRSAASATIRQTTTRAQSQDVVKDFPLVFLPKTSQKLRYGYSVLVQQQAQTAEEYAYWEKMRKNTENIGSLTDAQPTQLTGNVQCMSNVDEPVLGFVGVHSVTTTRLFIGRNDLPKPILWEFETGNENCPKLEYIGLNDAQLFFTKLYPGWIPLRYVDLSGGGFNVPPEPGFAAASPECTDVRTLGTNIKPSFWP